MSTNIDPNTAVNIRMKLVELCGAVPLDTLKAVYDWVTEPAKVSSIIPVTKEVKIVSA